MSDAVEERCRLLAGPAAVCAQISLALIVLAALLLRRARESPPRRTRTVFLFDVSKQFASSGAAHFSGLAFSLAAAAAAAGGSSLPERRQQRQPSECGWYLVLFSVDTVAGSALAIVLHRAAVAAAARWVEGEKKAAERAPRLSPPLPTASSLPTKLEPPPLSRFAAAVVRCGDYGMPPSLDLFLPQLLEWTCAVVLARLCCGFSVLALRGSFLSAVAAGVDSFFSSSRGPSLELFSVMLVGPLLMNAVQALVQDGVLREKRGAAARAGEGAGAGAGAVGPTAAAEQVANGGEGEEGAELLPSPSASSYVSRFSHHP